MKKVWKIILISTASVVLLTLITLGIIVVIFFGSPMSNKRVTAHAVPEHDNRLGNTSANLMNSGYACAMGEDILLATGKGLTLIDGDTMESSVYIDIPYSYSPHINVMGDTVTMLSYNYDTIGNDVYRYDGQSLKKIFKDSCFRYTFNHMQIIDDVTYTAGNYIAMLNKQNRQIGFKTEYHPSNPMYWDENIYYWAPDTDTHTHQLYRYHIPTAKNTAVGIHFDASVRYSFVHEGCIYYSYNYKDIHEVWVYDISEHTTKRFLTSDHELMVHNIIHHSLIISEETDDKDYVMLYLYNMKSKYKTELENCYRNFIGVHVVNDTVIINRFFEMIDSGGAQYAFYDNHGEYVGCVNQWNGQWVDEVKPAP